MTVLLHVQRARAVDSRRHRVLRLPHAHVTPSRKVRDVYYPDH